MDEDRNRKDAALSHSDGGPLKRVRDPGGLESEGLTLRSGSVLKGRTLHMSQINDPRALAESSAVTAQGQAVLSQSKRESAITHVVSAGRRTLHFISKSFNFKRKNEEDSDIRTRCSAAGADWGGNLLTSKTRWIMHYHSLESSCEVADVLWQFGEDGFNLDSMSTVLDNFVCPQCMPSIARNIGIDWN